MADWECAICLESEGERTTHACGRHQFHTTCLNENMKHDGRCPICRFQHTNLILFWNRLHRKCSYCRRFIRPQIYAYFYTYCVHFVHMRCAMQHLNLDALDDVPHIAYVPCKKCATGH
jgi:Ring finger domain